MKTLVLLSLLALLAFQAQADPLPEAAEETNTDEQPGAEYQGMTISFGGPEGSALQDGARRGVLTCSCRNHCELSEHVYGSCNRRNLFCCR
ncbi:alpha-defensin 20-like [Alexandromys fortis]|uniref:alpha-defensin 20-like n=1 Tax=Alexandromys fortis TaxID=100897 RepID=UPI002153410E|nr:alpha-defensin 20-like [Microtus fortis]